MDTNPQPEPGNKIRWEQANSEQVRPAIIYVCASANEDTKTRDKRIRRCRYRAKKCKLRVVQVFSQKEAALQALETGEAKVLIVLSHRELALRPKAVIALSARLRKIGARVISCELTAEEIQAQKEEASRKRATDSNGHVHHRIRLVPGREELVTEPRTYTIVPGGRKPSSSGMVNGVLWRRASDLTDDETG